MENVAANNKYLRGSIELTVAGYFNRLGLTLHIKSVT